MANRKSCSRTEAQAKRENHQNLASTSKGADRTQLANSARMRHAPTTNNRDQIKEQDEDKSSASTSSSSSSSDSDSDSDSDDSSPHDPTFMPEPLALAKRSLAKRNVQSRKQEVASGQNEYEASASTGSGSGLGFMGEDGMAGPSGSQHVQYFEAGNGESPKSSESGGALALTGMDSDPNADLENTSHHFVHGGELQDFLREISPDDESEYIVMKRPKRKDGQLRKSMSYVGGGSPDSGHRRPAASPVLFRNTLPINFVHLEPPAYDPTLDIATPANRLPRNTFNHLVHRFLMDLCPQKRFKAIIPSDVYAEIVAVLRDPSYTARGTPQFRFWCKRQFSISWDKDEYGNDVLIHEGRRVAIKEDFYEIATRAHETVKHGGRDKTMAEIRKTWSYLPKEVVARFVSECPGCPTNRGKGRELHRQSLKLAMGSMASQHDMTLDLEHETNMPVNDAIPSFSHVHTASSGMPRQLTSLSPMKRKFEEASPEPHRSGPPLLQRTVSLPGPADPSSPMSRCLKALPFVKRSQSTPDGRIKRRTAPYPLLRTSTLPYSLDRTQSQGPSDIQMSPQQYQHLQAYQFPSGSAQLGPGAIPCHMQNEGGLGQAPSNYAGNTGYYGFNSSMQSPMLSPLMGAPHLAPHLDRRGSSCSTTSSSTSMTGQDGLITPLGSNFPGQVGSPWIPPLVNCPSPYNSGSFAFGHAGQGSPLLPQFSLVQLEDRLPELKMNGSSRQYHQAQMDQTDSTPSANNVPNGASATMQFGEPLLTSATAVTPSSMVIDYDWTVDPALMDASVGELGSFIMAHDDQDVIVSASNIAKGKTAPSTESHVSTLRSGDRGHHLADGTETSTYIRGAARTGLQGIETTMHTTASLMSPTVAALGPFGRRSTSLSLGTTLTPPVQPSQPLQSPLMYSNTDWIEEDPTSLAAEQDTSAASATRASSWLANNAGMTIGGDLNATAGIAHTDSSQSIASLSDLEGAQCLMELRSSPSEERIMQPSASQVLFDLFYTPQTDQHNEMNTESAATAIAAPLFRGIDDPSTNESTTGFSGLDELDVKPEIASDDVHDDYPADHEQAQHPFDSAYMPNAIEGLDIELDQAALDFAPLIGSD